VRHLYKYTPYISACYAIVIGKKPITCIRFEPPYDWKDDPIATNGVYLNNFDVMIGPGVSGNGGAFNLMSKLELPYLQGNDFSRFAISVWFKRAFQVNISPAPIIASNGDCLMATIEVRN